MLTNSERALLKKYLREDGYEIFLKCANILIEKYKDENVIGKTAYETIKMTLTREAKVAAVKDFLTTLEYEAESK